MDIIDINSTVITIFKMDSLDWHIIAGNSLKTTLKDKYNLVLRMADNPFIPKLDNIVHFENGEYHKDGIVYFIDKVLFESRKLVINMQTETDIVENFLSEFLELLKSLSSREYSDLLPVIKTYETASIVKFKDTVNDLFNQSPISSISDSVSTRIDPQNANFSISFQTLRLRISFFNIPERFRKHNVTLADKSFIIERRINTPPDDVIFFTSSPLPSDQHIAILKEIENMEY